MVISKEFWAGKRVFLTGHTGFKGAWMSILLTHFDAEVSGYSLDPATEPNLFDAANVSGLLKNDYRADITELDELTNAIKRADPDIVIHMAAQSLVLESYKNPVTTYATNLMGTVNVLEAIRSAPSIKAALMITTDKCYENKESDEGYIETDRLGGYDPYSNSKACAEFAVRSFRDSFFSKNGTQIATVRAGNVIGGGDWAENRLIPDCVKAFSQNREVSLRSPHSVRPWQHVIEPLNGYLLLVEKLYTEKGQYDHAWNFGPSSEGEVETAYIAKILADLWGDGAKVVFSNNQHNHVETKMLRLNSNKAKECLGWQQKWDVIKTLEKTVEWYCLFLDEEPAYNVTIQQIEEYLL